MAEKITERLVKGIEPPAKGYRIIYDTEIKGFGIRVTKAGDKSFVFNYRVKGSGREHRITIGRFQAAGAMTKDKVWTVAAAREEAKDLKRRVDVGGDPMGDLHAKRRAPTVNDLADYYREHHLPTKRETSRRNDEDMLRRYILPKMSKIRVVDVQHSDIARLHRSLKDRPYLANRVVALLSKMFSMAIHPDLKWRDDNPAKGIKRNPEQGRERWIEGDERARLLIAMQEHAAKSKTNAQTVNAFRLAMLTGARIGECLSAPWDQFNIEAKLWIKPSAHTKQNKLHRVALNAPALALLSEIKAEGAWLFPNPNGDGPQRDYKHSWAAIIKAAKIDNLRVHDLRHNFASEGVAAGLSLPMIGALLGHTNPATTARYAHLMDDPMRQATERIGSRLTADSALVGSKDGSAA